MADRTDDIVAAFDAQFSERPFGTPQAFEVEGPGFMDTALNFGAGSLFGGLETLDQLFGNPVRNLIGGHFGAAAESFVRGLLPGDRLAQMTGIEGLNIEDALFGKPYDTFTGAELLEQFGVDDVNLFLGIGSRDIGGFGVEVLTDPLNLFGGAIAKVVGGAARGVGGSLLRGVEGIARQRTLINTTSDAFQRGTKIADFLDVPGISLGLHAGGATAGAIIGGVKAHEEGEGVLGGAALYGLLGLAGGAAVSNAGLLSRGLLGAGDLFSDSFALGRRLGPEGAEAALDAKQLASADRANRIQAAIARADHQMEVLEQQVAATTRGVEGLTPESVLNDFVAQLRGLTETTGAPEILAARELGGTVGTTFGSRPIAPQTIDDLRVGGSIVTVDDFVQGEAALPDVLKRIQGMDLPVDEAKALAEDATKILKTGGDEAFAKINARFDALPKSLQDLFIEYHAGDPLRPLTPGRIDVTKDLVDRGILDQRLLTATLARTGVAYLPHMRSANTAEQAVSELLEDLKKVGGIELDGSVGFAEALRDARSAVRELSDKGLQGTKRRELLGTIEEINRKYGAEFLEESFAKLGIEDVRRWSSLTSTDDLMQFMARDVADGGFVRNLPAMVAAADDSDEAARLLEDVVRGLVDGDQVFVSSSAIPKPMQKMFGVDAKDPRLARELVDLHDELAEASKLASVGDIALVDEAAQFERRVASEMSRVRRAVEEIQGFKRSGTPNQVVVENAAELRRLEKAIDRAAKRLESIVGEPTPSFTPDDFLDVGPSVGGHAARQANAAGMADRLKRINAARAHLKKVKGQLVSGRPQHIDLPSELLDVRAVDTLEDALLRGRDLGKRPGSAQEIAAASKRVGERKAARSQVERQIRALDKKIRSGGDTVRVPVVMDRFLFDDLFGKNGAVTRILDPQAPNKVLKIWQDVNRLWTGWTLGPFASWMNRNIVGNIWNNYLSGVGIKHTKTYKLAASIQDDVRKFATGRVDEITGTLTVGDKTWNRVDLVQELLGDGIVQGGFAYTAAGEEALKAMSLHEIFRDAKKLVTGKMSGKRVAEAARRVFAFDPQQNFFSRAGFSLNAILEDIPRITHYLAKQSEGMSRFAARRSTLKALGNFRELSAGDEALRQVMPFWSWTRFNVPRQVRGLLEGLGGDVLKDGLRKGFRAGPVPMAAHLQIGLNDKFEADIPDEILPEYLQGQMALPMGFNSEGKFEFWSLNRWLPLADLTEIDSPKKMLQFLTNSLSPFLNEPIEQAFNFDTFYKEVIENYPGEQEHLLGYPLNKRGLHLLRNLRVITEFDTWMSKILEITPTRDRLKGELAWYDQVISGARQFTGLKGRTVDLKKAKKFRVLELRRQVGDLKRRIKRARKKGDAANERNYRRLWLDTKQQLRLAKRFRPERNPHFRALELQAADATLT